MTTRNLGGRERDDELQCRICATDICENDGVHIFADDGRRHYLQAKIRKYLYILVSTEDKLSRMVCGTCVKRLEGVHRFAMMAYRTQERLKLQLHEHSNGTNINTVQDSGQRCARDMQGITKAVDDRGLLHSILTKVGGGANKYLQTGASGMDSRYTLQGAIEIVTENESLGPSELPAQDEKRHTPSMEEMEVKVDPMLFLQCGMEQSASEASDTSDAEERVTQSSSPEPGYETNRNDVAKNSEGEQEANEAIFGEEVVESSADVGTKAHECTICTRSFISQIGLQNHLWSHLPRERRNDGKPILRSQQAYSTNGAFLTSADSNIPSGNFVCPICSKKISTKGNLKVHLETHRPKGKYGCDICGRIFKTQSNLFRHKEYHGGVQFPCNVCGRVYPTNSTLRAHSITHSDLRPHACPLCDKTFKRNQDLKFHINQHTGARPYQCPYCPKAFASSGNCFSHRKRMHPREVHRDRQRAADLMR